VNKIIIYETSSAIAKEKVPGSQEKELYSAHRYVMA
jgi:hypothetical protein